MALAQCIMQSMHWNADVAGEIFVHVMIRSALSVYLL